MKNIIILISLIVLMTMFSCNPCKNKDCGQGNCDEAEGSCICNPGWGKDASGKCTVEDKCFNKDCGHGQCVPATGNCDCDPGYELGATSNKCDVESRFRFIGTWRGTDCGVSSPHNIIITPHADITKVNISNYGNAYCGISNLVATASVNPDYPKLENFTTDCASSSIKATGNSITLDAAGTTMTCSYNITVGGTDYTCTLTYTKQ